MSKPEKTAEALANRMKGTVRTAAQSLPDAAIGRMVLRLLADRDAVSINDLITAFQSELEEAEKSATLGAQVTRGEAEGAIMKLRSLRAPGTADA